MESFARPWFVAGGWAIDCYLNERARPHSDIEIAVFRRDQRDLQEHLDGWSFEKAIPGNEKTEPWRQGERLELPVHELHGRNSNGEPRTLEVLLNENDGDRWVFRRNCSVTRSLSKFGMATDAGIPFVSPEIVLLYKLPIFEPHDETDFENTYRRLDTERREWLESAIRACDCTHPWLERLEAH